jgi:phenylacetic acid degradation operon negative regulatory protein
LLLAGRGKPISVRDAIRACALFDLSENNVRVTMVRLSAEGLIQSPDRGYYALGPAAQDLAKDVGSWRELPQRLQDWAGDWLCCDLGRAGRMERKAKRLSLRALEMTGLRMLEDGLYLRPANLKGSASHLQQRLIALGLPSSAMVARLSELDEGRHARARSLWNPQTHAENYRRRTEQLRDWLGRHAKLDLNEAARESYLLGAEAIRDVVFDPWLPEPFIDNASRQTFFDTVLEFDAAGQDLWRRFYSQSGGMPLGGGESFSLGR